MLHSIKILSPPSKRHSIQRRRLWQRWRRCRWRYRWTCCRCSGQVHQHLLRPHLSPAAIIYEVYRRLDNFSFPVGGRSAARQTVFRHRWPKVAIFNESHLRRESTPNFGPNSMKLGPIVRFTKKMTLNKCGPGSGPNYGETAVCPLGREGNKWPKLRFSLYKHPQNGYSPLIIW